jgi:hypothetical protein
MSQVVLELPQPVYSALLNEAEANGTTLEGFIETRFSASLENSDEERVQGLAYYLGTVSAAGEITPSTAALALKFWNELRRAVRGLPVPDAAPGPEGQLLYTWNRAEHHLEAEIFPNGSIEMFYRNRITGDLWGHDSTAGDALSEEVITRLRLMATTHE